MLLKGPIKQHLACFRNIKGEGIISGEEKPKVDNTYTESVHPDMDLCKNNLINFRSSPFRKVPTGKQFIYSAYKKFRK